MSSSLISDGVWNRISSAARNSRGRTYVAVAYFGNGGSKLLPLKAGSTLLVDASDGAVKAGQTDPSELLKLYKKRVKIYSCQGLHAKVFVFGDKTFVGSTNVSSNSANSLIEAVVMTVDHKVRSESVAFIESCCTIPLGEESLKRLTKLYRPPTAFGPTKRKRGPQRRGKTLRKTEQVYVVGGLEYCRSYRDKEDYRAGLERAEAQVEDYKVHTIDDFEERALPIKKGELVFQIVSSGRKKYALPLGRLINTKKIKGTQRCFYYLEVPRNKRRRAFSRLSSAIKSAVKRGGRKNMNSSSRIIAAFK